MLGGLIGMGGAEFRLPLLITVSGYATLPAVVVNLIVSLVTVFFSFIFRLRLIGLSVIASNLSIIVNILAGSLAFSPGTHLLASAIEIAIHSPAK